MAGSTGYVEVIMNLLDKDTDNYIFDTDAMFNCLGLE